MKAKNGGRGMADEQVEAYVLLSPVLLETYLSSWDLMNGYLL